MPISKSLSKLEKRKGSNSLNPRSRKFKQLNRAQIREDRLTTKRALTTDLQKARNLRLHYFKEFVKALDRKSYTSQDIRDMIVSYVERNLPEIEELQASRRPGRPTSSRQDLLQRQLEADNTVYRSGILVPDLRDAAVTGALLDWDGSQGGVAAIRMVEFKKDADDPPLIEPDATS